MITSPLRTQRTLTLTGYFSFILIGCNAVLVPSLIRSIEHDFHQSDAGLGLFYLLSSLLYAAGSFIGGLLTERLGRRWILITAAFLCGLGLIGTAAAPVWPLFLVSGMAVTGGAGAIDGGVNGLFLDLYQRARGGALNLLHSFFGVGALLAPFAVGRLLAAGVSWRVDVLALGIGALVLAALLLAVEMPAGLRAEPGGVHAGLTRTEQSLLPFVGLAVAICCYVAAEMAVSGWLVKFLGGVPVTTATAVLSIFWGGLALGRVLSNWVAERMDYVVFTVGCIVLASGMLVGALLVPVFPLSVVLFGFAGLFYGPVYPMIMAIGGNLYPHRIAALSGSIGAAAVVGSVFYPPLIGFMATHVGLRTGLLGAGVLGVPAALAIIGARAAARRAAASERVANAPFEAAL
jgi:MFS transporter, FHS family, glucose/mannose:H+ symporter